MARQFGPHDTGELCRFLEELGVLHHSAGAWHWTSDTYPADAVSLRVGHQRQLRRGRHHRRAQGDRRGRLPRGARRRCTRRRSTCTRRGSTRWSASTTTAAQGLRAAGGLRLLHRRHRLHAGEGAGGVRRRPTPLARREQAAHGDVRVNRQIVGFKKVKFYTIENVGAGKLSHAGAGDAHDVVLAALPGGVPRALPGPDADREAEAVWPAWATRCGPWRRCC